MFVRVIPVDVYFIFSVPLLTFVQMEIFVKKNRINQAHINGNTPVVLRCVTLSS